MFDTRDLELEIAEGLNSDIVAVPSGYQGYAKDGATPPEKPKPLLTMPEAKSKIVKFPGATILDKAKDLRPTRTEIYVRGELQDFDGLRYMNDDKQRIEPKASYVVTHGGRFGEMYGRSVLDNVYQHWYTARFVELFANSYLERKGDPPVKGRAPIIATYDESGNIVYGADIMRDGYEKLRSGNIIVMPSTRNNAAGELDYDFDYLKDTDRSEMMVRYLEYLIRMMLWACSFPTAR